MPTAKYTTIAELAARSGAETPCAGNLPVRLDDPDCVWFIDRGAVDLFLVEFQDGVEQAAPQHLLRAEQGRILPGVAPDEEDTTLRLIAKGLPGTMLKRLPASALAETDPVELAEQADTWLIELAETLSRYVSHRPRPDALAAPGTTRTLGPGTVSVRRGLTWVTQPPPGASLYMDLIDWAEVAGANSDREGAIPLANANWLTLLDETELAARSSVALAEEGLLLSELACFHAVAFALERLNRRLAVVDHANLERARASSRRRDEATARRRLFNIHDLPVESGADIEDAALANAMRIIGDKEGIEFRIPRRGSTSDTPLRLIDILDASGVRTRRVKLKAEDKWWLGDSAAMLAFRSGDGGPVALLPGALGRYRMVDPISKRSVRLTSERAATLETEAWMFYRPLPPRSAEAGDLLRIGLHGAAGDVFRLILTGLPASLIKLLPAIALGFVANHVLQGGNPGAIYTVTAALAGFGVIGALLHLLQGSAMMRLEGRSASRIEAAFWDRLLRLPTGVLHRYPAGDLAMRGMTFQNLRDGVQGVVADSVLSIVFLLPVFGLIFFYDDRLGLIALAFSLASLLVTFLIGLRQILPYGRMIGAVRTVAGRLFQIINGIAKLRVENAEGSAFAIWARDYREQKRAELELSASEGHLQAFGAALPFLTGAVLLLAVVTGSDRTVPTGDFLVVYTVFIAFQAAVARLGESFGAVAAMMPGLEQIRPLLAVAPESASEGEPVEHLGGEILFDHVTFRYDPDGPLILDDVTIRARPGEFIAVAGESGAGKSTLFQLALGLEQPGSGAVYYDGRDLRRLNLKQLRRKIGAVPQAVQLHPQDLWDNIVAHHEGATTEEVWRTAQSAGIESEIKAMPMGMMTPVGTSGSVLSGGESQRVTIARSLIRSPRILLLDEATNWLDNENQAEVMNNLAALTSTRIVIAHRLSTLEQADRIYVMQAGKVVQVGSFEELMEIDGAFRDLVKRQIV